MPTDSTAAPTPGAAAPLKPTDTASATTVVVPAQAAEAEVIKEPSHDAARAGVEARLRTDGFAQATRAPRTTAVAGAPVTR